MFDLVALGVDEAEIWLFRYIYLNMHPQKHRKHMWDNVFEGVCHK